ncbi:MAG TPA: DUF6298 domain-containing protein [Candidatus Acidoferrum sp.]|nr:DUF6298 domain-containing protein [Candidatus Acidoferrum sp.]
MTHLRFTIYDLRSAVFVLLVLLVPCFVHAAPKKISPIISMGADGRLVYDADERGDRVPDFSTCGYAGGNRPLPEAPAKVVVAPVQGDETERIQRAIDYVAKLPPDTNGLRGAVLLLKGRHEVFGSLPLTNSGVVLRGQGMGPEGTTLVAAGTDRRTLIRIAGRDDLAARTNADWQIVDFYVPVGATSFHVRNPGDLAVGDAIRIIRPSTRTWIDRLGMTEFGGGIGDWRLVWHPGSYDVVWDRTVLSVNGTEITVSAPITTALESSFGGARLETYSWPGRIHNVGVENLRLESAFAADNPKNEDHSWMAITLENVRDAWVRQVTFEHFAGSAVAIYESCKWVTVEDCLSLAPVSEEAGARRNSFFTMGQQTLFLRCWAEHGHHDFSVGHCAAGPNAFVQCEAALPFGDSGPIESWASGVLYDNVRIDGNGLSLANRGSAGEGAGWAAANSVLWQCSASLVRCENPPTAQNWAFGCWGEFAGNGNWRESNSSVRPVSLLAAQLADRLGADTPVKIKLMPRSLEEYSNPTLEQAAKLIAASRSPAPQLRDYIAAAASREPIASEPGNAKSVDDLPAPQLKIQNSKLKISVTNGWLVCDGRLLIGEVTEVNWWRGNLRPSEAPTYGPTLTRFAPGRQGRGYTDDLSALADAMTAGNQVALDQHYGLWYDRRREDHERVRRMDGDAWAPFYEQPFARSGQGTAWDGLSQYDLTKFNPWYWSRLREFAGICDERGLVLFNENYFQHNILEAGAHWVDCPWRTMNNVNQTGFPEPPPFAGDKRIFMAEQFYDVTNAVRRQLHRNYIRQSLNNFTNHANVIQFASAEFTGPLAFLQFWLDTVGEWERETGRQALVALSCTKDVQDAILADPQRRPLVDVVQFKYWWTTDKGTFAPKGGQNLAPRQFERQWKGGRPTDANLASMAAEYRQRYPDQAVINDFNSGGWAYVCAGGSLPNLPKTTDPKLLAAIPRMTPWVAACGTGRWALREQGKQALIYGGNGTELDLSDETGSFRANMVNLRTGELKSAETVPAGGRIRLPDATLVWLVKE